MAVIHRIGMSKRLLKVAHKLLEMGLDESDDDCMLLHILEIRESYNVENEGRKDDANWTNWWISSMQIRRIDLLDNIEIIVGFQSS